MRLGDKPIAEMSESEMLEAIGALHEEREALRAEAIKRKRERDAGAVVKEPKTKVVKIKEGSVSAEMLAFLKGDNDEIK